MYWLRSALLYLFLAGLLVAGIWLFWGDRLRQKTNAKIAPAQKALTPPAYAPPARRISKEPPQPSKEARQHAASAFVALAQSIAEDNRQQLAIATALYEQRYRELLVHLGAVKRELSPTQPNAPPPQQSAPKKQARTTKARPTP